MCRSKRRDGACDDYIDYLVYRGLFQPRDQIFYRIEDIGGKVVVGVGSDVVCSERVVAKEQESRISLALSGKIIWKGTGAGSISSLSSLI